MTKSRQKGKVGEREAAAALTALGINSRRAVQYAGSNGDADLTAEIDGVHFEVKYQERLDLTSAVAQASDDAGDNLPVVLFRRVSTKHRGNPWLVIHRLEDWVKVSESVRRATDGEKGTATA